MYFYIFNWAGLAGMALAMGAGMGAVAALERAGFSTFVVLTVGLNVAALVASLYSIAYDRHGRQSFFTSHNNYMKALLQQGPHPGRIALFCLPLAFAPAVLLFSFLFFWVCGILPMVTMAQGVVFIVTACVTLAVGLGSSLFLNHMALNRLR